jgi:hypothetical protein
MIRDVTVLTVALVFVGASYLHGNKNSRRAAQFSPDMRILHFYYVATSLFTLCVIAIGARASHLTWKEAGFAFLMVATIHAIRAYFERDMDPYHCTGSASVRYGVDALANLSTILFALFATAGGDRLLVFAAFGFGLLLILKELKFRISDDVDHIDHASLPMMKDKRKRLLEARRAKRRDFFANYIKSYFYITIGFAILYRVLAIFSAHAGSAIADNGTNGVSPAWDALWFSVKSIALASAPGHVLLLQFAMGVQFVTSIALATQVLLTVYRSSQS